ncbi:hypothetical protein GCM10027521_46330 [Amycolatopsis cihanbeyliensis]
MTIIYGRLLREHARRENERVAHLIPLPSDGTLPTMLTALCGARFPPGVLENLPGPSGAPCTACLAARSADRPGPLPTPYPRDQTRPQVAAVRAVGGTAAMGLRDEQLIHRVPDKPLASVFNGRTVVITVCGALAYVAHAEPPSSWSRCSGCNPPPPGEHPGFNE